MCACATFEDHIVTTDDGFRYYYNENSDEGAFIIEIPNDEELIIPEYLNGKNNITTVFIVQNALIALIVFAFSCIMIKYAIMPTLLMLGATPEFPFPWYELIGFDYFILFGIIVFTSILSSLLPLINLSKKTPRELMVK